MVKGEHQQHELPASPGTELLAEGGTHPPPDPRSRRAARAPTAPREMGQEEKGSKGGKAGRRTSGAQRNAAFAGNPHERAPTRSASAPGAGTTPPKVTQVPERV